MFSREELCALKLKQRRDHKELLDRFMEIYGYLGVKRTAIEMYPDHLEFKLEDGD